MFNLTGIDKAAKRYASLLLGMVGEIHIGLLHSAEWIDRLMNGETPPSHWTASALEHLPDDPDIRKRAQSLVTLAAQKLAGRFFRSEQARDRLNIQIVDAKAELSSALADADRFQAETESHRLDLRDDARRISELTERVRRIRQRAVGSCTNAGAWWGLAAAVLAAEVFAIATSFFQAFPTSDAGQQIGTWSLSTAIAAALAYLVERGLRPVMDPSLSPGSDPRSKRVLVIALVGTAVLAAAIACVRVYAMSEGGVMDAAYAILNVVAVPFLALVSGRVAGFGVQQFAELSLLMDERKAFEDERDSLMARLVDHELHEQDLAAKSRDAERRVSDAEELEAAATRAKQELLQQIFEDVAGAPEIQQIITALAQDAVAFDNGGSGNSIVPPTTGVSGGGWRALFPWMSAVCLLFLMSVLVGCSGSGPTGTSPKSGTTVLVDPSPSVTDRESFRLEVRNEFTRFLGNASGSHFEVWSVASTPGSPRLVYQSTLPRVLPRQRTAIRHTAQLDFDTASRELFPEQPVPWSSVLEDGYRSAERMGSLPLERRRLVVLTDLLQHSPDLRLSRILAQDERGPLVQSVLETYPRLSHPPNEVLLVYLPGRAGSGNLSPAQYAKVKTFWHALWTAWGAQRVEFAEPGFIQQGETTETGR